MALDSALAVAAAARQCADGVAEFGLRIGPVSGSRGAIRFSVAPWSSLLGLHRAWSTATREVLGKSCVMATATFRPHISIAYANKLLPMETMVGALEPRRSRLGPSVVIDQVSLVRLERVERSHTICPIEQIALPRTDGLTDRRVAQPVGYVVEARWCQTSVRDALVSPRRQGVRFQDPAAARARSRRSCRC